MANSARIPLSPSDEQKLSSLARWMTAFAALHLLFSLGALCVGALSLLGSTAMFAIAPGAGVLSVLEGLVYLAVGLALLGEAAAMVLARAPLVDLVKTDTEDQAHVVATFKSLRAFFALELVVFALVFVGSGFGTVRSVIWDDELDSRSLGQQVADTLREQARDR